MTNEMNGHGGRRPGAGRPKGSRMRRSDELAEGLVASGKCPVEALVRLAERAEAEGDIGQAIGAWKSVLPYIYPKPKAVEVAPEDVIQLALELASTRAQAAQVAVPETYVDMLQAAKARLPPDQGNNGV